MYTLEGSLCLRRDLGSDWERLDLTAVQLYAAYKEFRQFFLILSHPSVSGDLYVNMGNVILSQEELSLSVNSWLTFIGDRALEYVDKLPDSKKSSVHYGNLEQLGYDIKLAEAGINLPDNTPIASLNDISVKRSAFYTDMRNMEKYCLGSVNGLLHNFVGTENEAFMLDGGRVAKTFKANTFGILSFANLGKLKIIKGQNVSIRPFDRNNGGTLFEKMAIELPEDIGNRSYFLVLGGYMVLPKAGVFHQTSDNLFMLDFNKLPYEERLLETWKPLKLGSLVPGLETNSGINIDMTREQGFLRKYMSLPQSFVVLVDCPSMQVSREMIQKASFPGQYLVYNDPSLPLFGSYGRVLDYWKREENGKWHLECYDNYHRQYIFTEGPRRRAVFATDALDMTRRYRIGEGFFLDLSTVKE